MPDPLVHPVVPCWFVTGVSSSLYGAAKVRRGGRSHFKIIYILYYKLNGLIYRHVTDWYVPNIECHIGFFTLKDLICF